MRNLIVTLLLSVLLSSCALAQQTSSFDLTERFKIASITLVKGMGDPPIFDQNMNPFDRTINLDHKKGSIEQRFTFTNDDTISEYLSTEEIEYIWKQLRNVDFSREPDDLSLSGIDSGLADDWLKFKFQRNEQLFILILPIRGDAMGYSEEIKNIYNFILEFQFQEKIED